MNDSSIYKIELEVKKSTNINKKLVTKLIIKDSIQYILGRSYDEADIVLNDPRASRQHFVIRIYYNQLWIDDLETKNGTFLNGEKITKHHLSVGDVISLGEHIISIANITAIHDEKDITSMISCKTIEEEIGFGDIVRSIA